MALGEQATLGARCCLPGCQLGVRGTMGLASAMPGHLLAHCGGRSGQTSGDCPDAVTGRKGTRHFDLTRCSSHASRSCSRASPSAILRASSHGSKCAHRSRPAACACAARLARGFRGLTRWAVADTLRGRPGWAGVALLPGIFGLDEPPHGDRGIRRDCSAPTGSNCCAPVAQLDRAPAF
jgi:hypothetical protein